MDHPVTNLIETEGFVIASATDVGRKRSGNEDSHALWVSDDPAVRAKQGLLLVVCDGMGGANAGEVASQLAVDTVVQVVRDGTLAEDPGQVLREAVESANGAVHSQATANSEQRGMGTTCTALVLRGREVWIGHVGDSRAYLVRGDKVTRLTKDHSLVAELVEKGHLTEAEAKHDHRRNVVTRSVGALDHVQVDAERVVDQLKPGDTLVICSDGLHGQVTDYEIGMIAGEQPPAEACAGLIDLANERGGPDNITAIVARLGGVATAEPAPGAAAKHDEPAPKGPLNIRLLVGVALVLLVLVVAVGAMLLGQLKGRAGDEVAVTPPAGDSSAGAPAAGESAAPGDAVTGEEPPSAAPTESTPAPVAAEKPAPAASTPAAAKPAETAPAKPAAAKPAPAAPSGPGTVRLMTRPFQPSTFSVDGELYAQDVGFFSQSLPAGDHVVRVEGSAGGSVDIPVHVEAGGSYSLVADLPHEGALGSIEIQISGAGRAQVLVDGANYPEQAPCVVRNLAPGPHSIRVRGARGVLAQGPAEVTVAAGSTTRAEYKFGAGR